MLSSSDSETDSEYDPAYPGYDGKLQFKLDLRAAMAMSLNTFKREELERKYNSQGQDMASMPSTSAGVGFQTESSFMSNSPGPSRPSGSQPSSSAGVRLSNFIASEPGPSLSSRSQPSSSAGVRVAPKSNDPGPSRSSVQPSSSSSFTHVKGKLINKIYNSHQDLTGAEDNMKMHFDFDHDDLYTKPMLILRPEEPMVDPTPQNEGEVVTDVPGESSLDLSKYEDVTFEEIPNPSSPSMLENFSGEEMDTNEQISGSEEGMGGIEEDSEMYPQFRYADPDAQYKIKKSYNQKYPEDDYDVESGSGYTKEEVENKMNNYWYVDSKLKYDTQLMDATNIGPIIEPDEPGYKKKLRSMQDYYKQMVAGPRNAFNQVTSMDFSKSEENLSFESEQNMFDLDEEQQLLQYAIQLSIEDQKKSDMTVDTPKSEPGSGVEKIFPKLSPLDAPRYRHLKTADSGPKDSECTPVSEIPLPPEKPIQPAPLKRRRHKVCLESERVDIANRWMQRYLGDGSNFHGNNESHLPIARGCKKSNKASSSCVFIRNGDSANRQTEPKKPGVTCLIRKTSADSGFDVEQGSGKGDDGPSPSVEEGIGNEDHDDKKENCEENNNEKDKDGEENKDDKHGNVSDSETKPKEG